MWQSRHRRTSRVTPLEKVLKMEDMLPTYHMEALLILAFAVPTDLLDGTFHHQES